MSSSACQILVCDSQTWCPHVEEISLFASTNVLSDVCYFSTGLEIKEHVQKQEVTNSLPAPPQMPLPEIPQQWLVSVNLNI